MRRLFLVAPVAFALGVVGACSSYSSTDDAPDSATGDSAALPTEAGDAGNDAIDEAPDDDGASTSSPYASAVLADMPLSYWRVGESAGAKSAHDIGSGMVDGVYQSATVTVGVAGALSGANSAISALGTGPAVIMGDVYDFPGTASFALEAWFRARTVDAAPRGICGKKSDTQMGYSLWVQTPAKLAFGRYNGSDAGNFAEVVTALPPDPTAWTHVVASFDGTTMRLFVNGVIAGTTANSLALPDTAAGFAIGAKGASYPGSNFDGDIDEVAVYDHPLTPARVAAHYAAR